MLGKSPTTSFLHKRELICGYRRPKNLRDILVRAAIPYRQGDERANPQFVPQEEPRIPSGGLPSGHTGPLRQRSITDFLRPVVRPDTPVNPNQCCKDSSVPLPQEKGQGGEHSRRKGDSLSATRMKIHADIVLD